LLLVEPVLIAAAAATNPWHLGVYRGAGAAGLTGSAAWGYGPVFWWHTGYSYFALLIGIGFIAWGWWKAPPAFRRQRLTALMATLIPCAANVIYLARGFGDFVDPTPFGFAVAGAVIFYAIFRQDLFTFSPVARALIIDQIGRDCGRQPWREGLGREPSRGRLAAGDELGRDQESGRGIGPGAVRRSHLHPRRR